MIVADNSHYQTQDVLFAVAQERPYQERISRSNKGTLNHLVQARFDKSVTNETDYQPYKGTDKPITALLSITIDPARPYTNVTLQQKGDVQLLEVAMEKRHPNTPNARTFRELKFDRLDGAYRSIAMQKQDARTNQTHDLKIIFLLQQRCSVFSEKQFLGYAPIYIGYADLHRQAGSEIIQARQTYCLVRMWSQHTTNQ